MARLAVGARGGGLPAEGRTRQDRQQLQDAREHKDDSCARAKCNEPTQNKSRAAADSQFAGQLAQPVHGVQPRAVTLSLSDMGQQDSKRVRAKGCPATEQQARECPATGPICPTLLQQHRR